MAGKRITDLDQSTIEDRKEDGYIAVANSDTSYKVPLSDFPAVALSGDYEDLVNKPDIPDAQIQSDWNQTDEGAVDFIKNKPMTLNSKIGATEWTKNATNYNPILSVKFPDGTYKRSRFVLLVHPDNNGDGPDEIIDVYLGVSNDQNVLGYHSIYYLSNGENKVQLNSIKNTQYYQFGYTWDSSDKTATLWIKCVVDGNGNRKKSFYLLSASGEVENVNYQPQTATSTTEPSGFTDIDLTIYGSNTKKSTGSVYQCIGTFTSSPNNSRDSHYAGAIIAFVSRDANDLNKAGFIYLRKGKYSSSGSAYYDQTSKVVINSCTNNTSYVGIQFYEEIGNSQDYAIKLWVKNNCNYPVTYSIVDPGSMVFSPSTDTSSTQPEGSVRIPQYVNVTKKESDNDNHSIDNAVGSSNTPVYVDERGEVKAMSAKLPASLGGSDNNYTTDDKNKLAGIATGAEVNVQSDWSITDSSKDSYIKNKPTLGTAAAKNVLASGNASTTQVVMGNDTRLSNARPASDVSAWAKETSKPTYTASEVGAAASSHSHGNIANNGKSASEPTSTTKFLRADGSWLVPPKSLQYWSGGSTNIKGVYIGTCNLQNGWNGWITGTMSLTNYHNSNPNTANGKGIALGSFYLWAFRSGNTITASCRLYSLNARHTNTDLMLVYKKDTSDATTYKVSFYVCFGPGTTGGGTSTNQRPFGLGISYLENHNADIPESLTGITNDIQYDDDYYSIQKMPYLAQGAASVGSIIKPVYIGNNGEITPCGDRVFDLLNPNNSTISETALKTCNNIMVRLNVAENRTVILDAADMVENVKYSIYLGYCLNINGYYITLKLKSTDTNINRWYNAREPNSAAHTLGSNPIEIVNSHGRGTIYLIRNGRDVYMLGY